MNNLPSIPLPQAPLPAGRSAYFDLLRIMGCCAVVMVHVSDTLAGQLQGSLVYASLKVLRAPAVAVFFFTAGYWALQKPIPSLLNWITTKALRLLVPCIAISTLIGCLRFAAEHHGGFTLLHVSGDSFALWMFQSIFLLQAAPHLYFLPVLFCYYCIAVLAQRLFVRPLYCLCFSLVYTLIGFHLLDIAYTTFPLQLPDNPDLPRNAIRGFVYFLAGLSAFHYRAVLRSILDRYTATILIVFACTAGLSASRSIYIWHAIPLMTPLMLIAWAAAARLFLRNDISPEPLFQAAGLTMGIYLVHMPLVVYSITAATRSLSLPPTVLIGMNWFSVLLLSTAAVILIRLFPWGRILLGVPPRFPHPSTPSTF